MKLSKARRQLIAKVAGVAVITAVIVGTSVFQRGNSPSYPLLTVAIWLLACVVFLVMLNRRFKAMNDDPTGVGMALPESDMGRSSMLQRIGLRQLSFNERRVIGGIGLLACLVCVANYYLDLSIFGRFRREPVAASFIALFLILRFVAPSLREIQDYRDAKRQG